MQLSHLIARRAQSAAQQQQQQQLRLQGQQGQQQRQRQQQQLSVPLLFGSSSTIPNICERGIADYYLAQSFMQSRLLMPNGY
jgi:hypothetical protein